VDADSDNHTKFEFPTSGACVPLKNSLNHDWENDAVRDPRLGLGRFAHAVAGQDDKG
jgi:hypothetical protein